MLKLTLSLIRMTQEMYIHQDVNIWEFRQPFVSV